MKSLWKMVRDERFLLAGIILAGLGLRLINLSVQPYWGDELLSLAIINHFTSYGEMTRYLSQVEFHPPLYYVLLKPWIGAFGDAEVSTRSVSVLASLGTVVMTWLIGRRLFPGRKIGLVAATLVTILPLQLEYAQEARPYALFCLTTLVAAYGLVRYREGKRPWWLAMYVGSALASVYLHYSGSFGVIALGSWWLYEAYHEPKDARWKELRTWGLAHAALFLGFLPWLPFFLYKTLLGQFPLLGRGRNIIPNRQVFAFGKAFDLLIWTTKEQFVPMAALVSVLLAKCLLAVAVFFQVRSMGKEPLGRSDGGALGFLLCFAGITLSIFVLSPQSLAYSDIVVRHAIVASVPLMLLLAWLLCRLSWKQGAVLASIFVITLLPFDAAVLGNDAEWDKEYQWQSIGTQIAAQSKPGDLVVVMLGGVRPDLVRYIPNDLHMATLYPTNFYDQDIWEGRDLLGIVENDMQVRRAHSESAAAVNEKLLRLDQQYHPKRVWLVGVPQDDIVTRQWFSPDKWRPAFTAIGDIYLLDLYSRK
ncbi:MAG: hypothetical protein RLZZ324_226 [Candidatus Parcubacteria bacterium]|jgi:4-amino-4-deoxy-L-arabinose transferase-like glycosyltransferase